MKLYLCILIDMVKNSDMMWKQSVWTSTIAARLAALHLKDGGTITLTGAQPALSATPGLSAYYAFEELIIGIHL